MMQTPDISYFSLFLCCLLLLVPFVISIILKLGIIRSTVVSVVRMMIQLALIGIFLKYLFQINNPLINIAWLVIMIVVATFNVTGKLNLRYKIFILPIFIAFILATLFIVLYFTILVINLEDFFDARFFVVISGMLLGNSLRGNIIGVGNFYRAIRQNQERYSYDLAAGASTFEALLPYFRESIISALQPTIATMATMGIVFLPGMMTGQILGGLSPLLAIKYQIAIMIAIFTTTTIAVNLTIIFTIRTCFNDYGILKQEIFRTRSG